MFDRFRVRLAGLGPVVIRGALAGVFVTHGYAKFLTIIHGGNPLGRFPFALGVAAGLTEFVGGVCVALGLATRFWAAGHVILMTVAIWTVHWSQGFLSHGVLRANGKAAVGGFEFQLTLLLAALALFLMGPGPLSLDYLVGRWLRRDRANSVIGCGAKPVDCAGRSLSL